MEIVIDTARWVVDKALSPLSGGFLEAWAASSELGPNINALKLELLYAKGMLDNTQGREIRSQALKELLHKLQQLAFDSDDLLDELDYFRMHDELKGTYEAADVDNRSCIHRFIANSRHTVKAVCKSLQCSCTQTYHGDPGKPQMDVKGQVHMFSKCLPCYSCPLVHDEDADDASKPQKWWQKHCSTCYCNPTIGQNHANEVETHKFDRVGISTRMKHIVEQLQSICAKVSIILNMEMMGSSNSNIQENATSQRLTISESVEPKLYGREEMKKKLIDDITRGIYSETDLSVLSLFGPGGIGKTTLVQYIYNNQEVQSHFQVKIWVCVSFNFNVSVLMQQTVKSIPEVDGKNVGSAEELIEQRLKSKRFLLILDDMWKCDDEDEWKRLLVPFRKGQAKGNVVMVTTRFPALAEMVKTTEKPIELERLEDEEFMHFFEACVFGEGKPSWESHRELKKTGEKIIGKLKGFPLAAKTVGRLLRNNLTLSHWTKVLASKEWEFQTGLHDIMPALKLSYAYLHFHLQKCFSYCGLFPHDYEFGSAELIHLWMGLKIISSNGQKKTLEEIGLSYINDLVDHGFLKKPVKDGPVCYVMHDLLQDLARMVSSYECFTIDCYNERLKEIPLDVRHLSIIVGGIEEDGTANETFSRDLISIRKRFKAENLHTLMIFGQYDRSIANTFGDLFIRAKALRVLRLPTMYYPVEHMLHNFSVLIHLRYLKLESDYNKSRLPISISRFYKLIVLDLKDWKGNANVPVDMSNLTRLRHFIVSDDRTHSKISEVGKLSMLQELRRFDVKRSNSGFELKQLGQLTELSESLSICNLEKVQANEEAVEVNMLSKNCLKKLTLEWDIQRSTKDPDKEAHVLNVLRPHDSLQELCIRGHGGHSCPAWLGNKLSVRSLQSLHLDVVDWNVLPPLGELWFPNEPGPEYLRSIKEKSFHNLKSLELVGLVRLERWVYNDACLLSFLESFIIRDCTELVELPFSHRNGEKLKQDGNINSFPKIKELRIDNCPKLESVPLIPWTDTLEFVDMKTVGSNLEKLVYSCKSSSSQLKLKIKENHSLRCLDEMVAFHNLSELHELKVSKGPALMHEHLHMLTSLKRLEIYDSSNLLQPLGGPGDEKNQFPVERLEIQSCSASGEELTQLLRQMPNLSFFRMSSCQNVTRLGVEEQLAMTSSSGNETGTQIQMEEEDDKGGVMFFPSHLSISLRNLQITKCPGLRLGASSPPPPNSRARGGLHGLHSLQEFFIRGCPKFLSAYSPASSYCCPFPSSLDHLRIEDIEDMDTLAFLSNLTTLTYLFIENCGKDLKGEGLQTLFTQGPLTDLCVYRSPKFFDSWESCIAETSSQQQEESLPYSCKLQVIRTDDVAGVLTAPVCTFLSSSLVLLGVCDNKEVVSFTKEQEKALELITFLQELCFSANQNLQSLPVCLHRLPNLKKLEFYNCPAIRSLPKNGLPASLMQINVDRPCNEELEHQCIMLEGISVNISGNNNPWGP